MTNYSHKRELLRLIDLCSLSLEYKLNGSFKTNEELQEGIQNLIKICTELNDEIIKLKERLDM